MIKETIKELIPGKDTKIVLDELYYTITGAMKKLNFGRNKILTYVNDGTLETYVHGNEYLFSTGALMNCVKKHTVKGLKKK